MSWQKHVLQDAERSKITGTMELAWECPRCKHKQVLSVPIADVVNALRNLHCQNVNVCGEGQSRVEIELSIAFMHNDVGKAPLQEVVQS
jgi:hypothetical protein